MTLRHPVRGHLFPYPPFPWQSGTNFGPGVPMRQPLCFLLFLLALAGRAQERALYYPEDMQEDLEVFRKAVHQSHPAPYRYVTRTELDRAFDSARAALRMPLDLRSLEDVLITVLRKVGDGHLVLQHRSVADGPRDDMARTIPLRVDVRDGGLHVVDELKGFRSLPPGARILRIDQLADTAIIARICAGLFSDGDAPDHKLHHLAQDFPGLFHRHVGQADTYVIHYRDKDGGEASVELRGMTRQEMAVSIRETPERTPLWYVTDHAGIGTMWFTVGTLDEERLLNEGIKVDRVLKDLAQQLQKGSTKVLVIDVRGAGGRELHMAEKLFALIAQEPYRVVQDMAVRSMDPPPGFKGTVEAEAFYASAAAHFLPAGKDAYTLRPDDPRLEHLVPSRNAFAGKVYVVTDGGTVDAGAAFAIMAGRSGRAKLVGSTTGTNALASCGGRMVEVVGPRTGLVLRMPLMRYTWDGRLRGDPDLGEPPHHRASPRPVDAGTGRDSVKNALLMLIRELQ